MYSEYVPQFGYTTGTPETTFVIKVDDDKFVAGNFGNVKLIDIEPFNVDEMDLYLLDKIHPNAEGYEIIDRKIAEKMRELQ